MNRLILVGHLAVLLTVGACSGEEPASIELADPARRLSTAVTKEEEVFGLVWETSGQRATTADYYIKLRPDLNKDPGYWSRNADLQADFSDMQVIDPSRPSQHWGWYHPAVQNNAGICVRGHSGDIEQHTHEPLVLAGTPRERHCIRRGVFIVELHRPLGTILASRTIDFLDATTIGSLVIEDLAGSFTDNVVHFDRSGSFSITPKVDVTPQTGKRDTTDFQFRADQSTTVWNKDPTDRGRLSAEWTWNVGFPLSKSAYMNTLVSTTYPMARVHRYLPSDPTGKIIAEGRLITPGGNTATKRDTLTLSGGTISLCTTITIASTTTQTGQPVTFRWCPDIAVVNDQEHRWVYGDGSSTAWTPGKKDFSHTYNTAGSYPAKVEIRQTTMTSNSANKTTTITVQAPTPVNNATAISNSFPPTMSQGQFYAVSVIMENSGTATTWTSTAGYNLKKVLGGTDWNPASVAFGTGSVYPGYRKSFSFNLFNDGTVGQFYDVYYQMFKSTTAFGQTNGRRIEVLDPSTCTKNCSFALDLDATARSYPGGASSSDKVLNSQEPQPTGFRLGEMVQTLTVPGYPVHPVIIEGVPVGVIRYYGALAEPWDVDVEFRIVYEPGTISPGIVRRGIATTGYGIELVHVSGSELRVRLLRSGALSALPPGENLLLEIPLMALPARNLPQRLPLVELIITR